MDRLVTLVVVLPALGMTDKDVVHIKLLQHRTRDLSGEGTSLVLRDILRSQLDLKLLGVNKSLSTPQVSERWKDRDLDIFVVVIGVV